jgi:hypothetical protein
MCLSREGVQMLDQLAHQGIAVDPADVDYWELPGTRGRRSIGKASFEYRKSMEGTMTSCARTCAKAVMNLGRDATVQSEPSARDRPRVSV